MKERPILFAGDMVRAILDGRKTQTRRLAKNIEEDPRFRSGWKAVSRDKRSETDITAPGGLLWDACPYGQPGDRLWVRETWSGNYAYADEKPSERVSVMTPDGPFYRDEIWYWADGEPDCGDWERPRPSIHMPRWASRITLEIVSVRVERLQEISEEDAWNEGVQEWMGKSTPWKGELAPVSVHGFASLWEAINGDGSWAANPWVWVVEFKRVDEARAAA